MSQLHCISSATALDDCLRACAPDDTLLLLGDAGYCALAGTKTLQVLEASGCEIVILTEHAVSRGLEQRLNERIRWIDYAEFVALSERHPTQQAWF